MIDNAKQAFTKNNFDEALRLFLEAHQVQPDNIDALEGIARSYYRLKRFDDAIKYCDRALLVTNSLAWPYLILSYIYYLQKKLIESKQNAKVAFEMEPSGWETNFWWGSLLSLEDKNDEGLIFLEKAVAIEKNDWYLYNNLSIAYLNKGDLSKYYEALRQMNRLKPNLFNSVVIHLGRWAKLYSLLMMFTHYAMIVFALIFGLQILLIVPFLIDALWVIGGSWSIFRRRYRTGIVLVSYGLVNSIFAIVAYMALR